MKFALGTIILCSLLIGSAFKTANAQHFDDYGAISWENEKALLDSLAIQLHHEKDLVGYIFIFAENGGCPGEAQARAIRAKRYIVEHGGVPWNRVIWRVEGYRQDLTTIPRLLPPGTELSYPFYSATGGKDGPLTKQCKTRLKQIARKL
jgi:hypothetical protein